MTYESKTTQIDEHGTSQITRMKQSLAQREDFAGQTYRTIRDHPKTAAAVGAGVVAAAAGASAFLLNRKHKIGTATGHASSPSDEVMEEVNEINQEATSQLDEQTEFDNASKSEIKAGSVAY